MRTAASSVVSSALSRRLPRRREGRRDIERLCRTVGVGEGAGSEFDGLSDRTEVEESESEFL